MATASKFLLFVFLISPERLDTSNLVHASAMKSNFENMHKLSQRGCEPVYATYFKFADPCEYLSNGCSYVGLKFRM